MLAASKSVLVDRVAATVGVQAITRSAVVERAKSWHLSEKDALDRLIEERLIADEARRVGVSVTPEEVDAAIQEVLKVAKISRAELDEELKRQKMDLDGYRALLKAQLTELKWLGTKASSKRGESIDDRAKRIAASRDKWVQELRSKSVVELKAGADDKQPPPLGARVADVAVRGIGEPEHGLFTQWLSTQVDAGLSAEVTRSNLELLVESHWVRDAKAVATPLDKSSVQLTYEVEANPTLISIAGGRRIDPLGIFHLGKPTSPVDVRAGVDVMREKYAGLGYPNALIDWKLDAVDGGTQLKLDIDEGVRFTVAAVRFSGTQRLAVPSLKNVIKTQLGDAFSHDVVANDAQALTAVLLDHGFLEGTVATPEPKELKPGQIDVVYAVKEGPIYKTSAVAVTGWEWGPVPLKALETQKGQPYSAAGANRDLDRLRHQAAERGVEIDTTLLTFVDSKTHAVSVGFEVSKSTPKATRF